VQRDSRDGVYIQDCASRIPGIRGILALHEGSRSGNPVGLALHLCSRESLTGRIKDRPIRKGRWAPRQIVGHVLGGIDRRRTDKIIGSKGERRRIDISREESKRDLPLLIRRQIGQQRLDLLSRGTQIPEYVLEGCLAAFKSRNSPSCLYSHPGLKPMHGRG
jgi:hypothetical protein